MEAVTPLVVPLSDTERCTEELVGGKAAKLARLARAGCDVPPGLCLTVAAYDLFVRSGGIETAIRMELGRKSLDRMRWEEIWDAALRIRSVFLSHSLPVAVREALHEALANTIRLKTFMMKLSFQSFCRSISDVLVLRLSTVTP